MKKNENHKKELKNSAHIAVQSNQFIEARYKEALTFWESFLITKMCSMIAPDDMDFKPYKIYIKEIIDFMGVPPSGNVYNYVTEAAERLLDRKIVLGLIDEDGKRVIVDTHIVTSVRRLAEPDKTDNLFITLTFQPELKPFLIQLQRNFTKLDMEIYKKLKTASSIRLYHIFKSYIGKKKYRLRYELEDLKEMLGVAGKYDLYAGFKMRVLDEAQKRLSESTDIGFTFEEIKEGKRVSAIAFNLLHDKSDAPSREIPSDSSPALPAADYSALMSVVMEKFGVNAKVFTDLAHKYSVEEINAAIRVTQAAIKKSKIDNAAGFFVQALRGHFKENEDVQKSRKPVRNPAASAVTLSDDGETNRHAEKKAAYEKDMEKLHTLLAADADFGRPIVEELQRGMFYDQYNPTLSLSDNLKKPLFAGAFLSVAKRMKLV